MPELERQREDCHNLRSAPKSQSPHRGTKGDMGLGELAPTTWVQESYPCPLHGWHRRAGLNGLDAGELSPPLSG